MQVGCGIDSSAYDAAYARDFKKKQWDVKLY